jgi:hypothetical protein
MKAEAIIEKLLLRRNDEFRRRMRQENFWQGLEWSVAIILQSALSNSTPKLREIVLGAHLQCVQAKSSNLDSSACDIVASLQRLTERLRGTWRYMSFSRKQLLARQAVREQWSLKDGLRYTGYEGGEYYSPERLRQVTMDLNAAVRSGWSKLMTDSALNSDEGYPNVKEREPLELTMEDVWGTLEEWRKFSEMPKPPWGRFKTELKNLMKPHYQEVRGPLHFLKNYDGFDLQLEIKIGTSVGHFRYTYIVHDSNGQAILATSYEALLGIGLGIWDGVSDVNVSDFCEKFADIDKFIRSCFE